MAGEVKRHFRDKGWMIRVPRRLQERRIETSRAAAVLTRSLNRTPSQADLAGYLGVSEAGIRECAVSFRAYSARSLSAAAGADSAGALVQDFLGGPDPGLVAVEDRQSLCPLIRALPDRERSIIAMRFYEHMTQSQIADELGISQMHVSRQGPAVRHAIPMNQVRAPTRKRRTAVMAATRGTKVDGSPITDPMIEATADEAPARYDVENVLRRRQGGRPPMGSAAPTVESVRLDLELRRDLPLRAADENSRVSEAIRRAVRQYLPAS